MEKQRKTLAECKTSRHLLTVRLSQKLGYRLSPWNTTAGMCVVIRNITSNWVECFYARVLCVSQSLTRMRFGIQDRGGGGVNGNSKVKDKKKEEN